MGLTWRLLWVGKKQWRRLVWTMKAAVKKSNGRRYRQQQHKFQYDPSSYALNFDDGCKLPWEETFRSSNGFQQISLKCKHHHSSVRSSTIVAASASASPITWVYVLWVRV